MVKYNKFNNPSEFKHLFSNYKFRKNYSDYINGLMRILYQPIGNWGKLLDNGNYGIINTNIILDKAPMNPKIRDFYKKIYKNTDPKWSLLNYVNTHWSCFLFIINVVNYWINTNQIEDKEYFDFKINYFEELDRLKVILNKYGKFIFMQEHDRKTFWKIMGAIAESTYIGNRNENITIEYLSKLGDVSDVVQSMPGEKIDTHKGVDINFKLNGVNRTLQCKTCNNVKNEYGQFIFNNISNPGWYNVDYFSFVNKNVIYVFETKNNGLTYSFDQRTASYIFDIRLLKFIIEL